MDHFPEDWRVGKAIAKRQGSQKLAGLNQTRTVTRSPDSLRRPVPFLRFACGAVTIGILCLSSETRSLLSRGTRASIEPNGRFASPLLPSPPNALAASTATRSAVIDPATVKDPNSLNAFSTTTAKSGAPVATNNLSSTPTRLAGFVYLDLNDDGAMSIDDTPITSVEIELLDASGAAIATSTTTADGSYEFLVTPGTYTIRQVQPDGYIDGKDTAGTNKAAVTTNDQIAVTVAQSEQSAGHNFGEKQLSSISGKVYLDANNDGNVAIEEKPLSGITIELVDSFGTIVTSTTSLADGTYTFQNLKPGEYTVHEFQPKGYLDGIDTPGRAIGIGASSATTANDEIAIALEPFVQSVANNFGERPGIITGRILKNATNTDVDDRTGLGIMDISVQLLDNTGSAITATTTDPKGVYIFFNLAAGDYSIRQTPPTSLANSFDPQGAPNMVQSNELILTTLTPGQISVQNNFREPKGEINGMVWGVANTGATIGGVDSEVTRVSVRLSNSAGLVLATTTSEASGAYSFSGLAAGKYTVEQLQPARYQVNQGVAGGVGTAQTSNKTTASVTFASPPSASNYLGEPDTGQSSIFGTVFADVISTNGKQDSSFGYTQESGIAGATITLLNALGELVATTTTNANGDYSFMSLAPGTYSVAETQPAGYLDGIDRIGHGIASELPDKHKNLILPPYSYWSEVNFGELNPEANPGQVSGKAFVDLDENGLFSVGERSVPGASIMVYNSSTGAYVSGATADSNGDYSVTGLPAGTYSVVEAPRVLSAPGEKTPGTETALSRGNRPILVTVAPNGTSDGINFSGTFAPPVDSGPVDPNPPTKSSTAETISPTIVKRLANQLSFGGHVWAVKSSSGLVGPGPNQFVAENATVDAVGNLHLQITQDKNNGNWYSSEVINTTSLGYGTYRWTAVTDLSNLDRNVVLGLFTWSDLPDYANREIDIEVAAWGSTTDPTKAQFVVQPYNVPGHVRRFVQTPGGPSTLQFTWAPGRIDYLVRKGSVTVHSWSYVGPDVPKPGGETARMNLWQYQGLAPSNGQPVEIVFSDFDYCTPSGTCQ